MLPKRPQIQKNLPTERRGRTLESETVPREPTGPLHCPKKKKSRRQGTVPAPGGMGGQLTALNPALSNDKKKSKKKKKKPLTPPWERERGNPIPEKEKAKSAQGEPNALEKRYGGGSSF